MMGGVEVHTYAYVCVGVVVYVQETSQIKEKNARNLLSKTKSNALLKKLRNSTQMHMTVCAFTVYLY